MQWWGYVIIAGVIFILAVLVLIWIIVASNRLVVLKKNVDRNFPLINTKIKEYNKAVDDVLAELRKKIKTKNAAIDGVKKANKNLAIAEGIFNKIEKQRDVEKKVDVFSKTLNKQEELKGDKKVKNLLKDIRKIQDEINFITQKYNNAVQEYNETIARFPTRLVAERFKFEQAKKWSKE